MSQGERMSTPKSMLMPTAMKNRPSSRPLKGSMSASSSLRYSLSASSTPARKAPSAIDRPTITIKYAMPTTSSSEAAVKISGVRLLAIQRSRGRSSKRPPSTMAPITPTIFRASSSTSPAEWSSPAPAAAPSRGSSARMGMAATSWNSRIEKPARPLLVRMRLRSASTCSAMAVDDSASPSAATRLMRQGSPASQPAANSTAAQPSTCALPVPKMGRRMAQRRLGCSSSPTKKSMSTTPNSAKCRMSCTLLTSPRPHGPMAMPAAR